MTALASTKAIALFDIDGVVRDVGGSYRRALADTVETFTGGAYRPSPEAIDALKSEGLWNNDWEASQELVYRYFEQQGQPRSSCSLDYQAMVAFFQSRYRGEAVDDPSRWTGYITQEPLLMSAVYLDSLTAAQIVWGFVSGATRASACYVLEQRIRLVSPLLVAMEDAPGKPDPTGLFQAVDLLNLGDPCLPVIYAGDTVADMATVQQARQRQGDRRWIAVGILPPHVQSDPAQTSRYTNTLQQAGADLVLSHVEQLSPAIILELVR
jgi:HAD superfamily phosphatase